MSLLATLRSFPLVGLLSASILAVGCAPRAMPLTPEHPANPDAEPGRLAGPPAALRPGVAEPADPAPAPAAPAPAHEGHH